MQKYLTEKIIVNIVGCMCVFIRGVLVTICLWDLVKDSDINLLTSSLVAVLDIENVFVKNWQGNSLYSLCNRIHMS